MRVLQLIDSLNPGGAERMAITLSNELCSFVEKSYLCVTRQEGALKSNLSNKVAYVFLNKKSTLDLRALFQLRRFVKSNNISIVHAHTTSYFTATLLKIIYPKVRLIWHEHHGKRVQAKTFNYKALWFCSLFFNCIITVNNDLKNWCKKRLMTKRVINIPNFVAINNFSKSIANEKTIVCLANLRAPKNHLNLLDAFVNIYQEYPNWKLQLIGKDYNDNYSKEIKDFIEQKGLSSCVEILGVVEDVSGILKNGSIGVLSSDSEGLPVSLLEYGASALAVVTTNVGDCKNVIGDFGVVVSVNNATDLAEAIKKYISNGDLRKTHGTQLRKRIEDHYSIKSVLKTILKTYN